MLLVGSFKEEEEADKAEEETGGILKGPEDAKAADMLALLAAVVGAPKLLTLGGTLRVRGLALGDAMEKEDWLSFCH